MAYDVIYMGDKALTVTEEKVIRHDIIELVERLILKSDGLNETRMMYFACKLITPQANATTLVDKFGMVTLAKYGELVAYIYEYADPKCTTHDKYINNVCYTKFTQEQMVQLAELIMTTLKKREKGFADASMMPKYTKEKEECLHEYIRKEYEDMMKGVA